MREIQELPQQQQQQNIVYPYIQVVVADNGVLIIHHYSVNHSETTLLDEHTVNAIIREVVKKKATSRKIDTLVKDVMRHD